MFILVPQTKVKCTSTSMTPKKKTHFKKMSSHLRHPTRLARLLAVMLDLLEVSLYPQTTILWPLTVSTLLKSGKLTSVLWKRT